MSAAHEREVVKGMYPKSPRWIRKVDAMSDRQVIAIYMRTKKKR